MEGSTSTESQAGDSVISHDLKTVVELLQHRAAATPTRGFTFLGGGEGQEVHLSFQQLDAQSRAVAAVLQRESLSHRRALLLFPTGLEFLPAYYGCLYAGTVAIPAPLPIAGRLNRLLPRIQGIVRHAAPAVILTDRSGLKVLQALREASPDFRGLKGWAIEDLLAEAPSAWTPPPLSPDSLAHLQYTSGSTSEPRAVMIRHNNLLASSHMIQRNKGVTHDSVSVMWVPAYHDDGLVQGLIQPVYSGISCILMTPTDVIARPDRWLKAISRFKATHSGGPNFLYEVAVNRVPESLLPELDLSCWNYAYNAAEPIRWETLQRFYERFRVCGLRLSTLAPCYGLAEATLVVSATPPGEGPRRLVVDGLHLDRTGKRLTLSPEAPAARTLVSSGVPVVETQLVIAEPGGVRLCAQDEVGEILIQNPAVAAGYLDKPEDSAVTFGAFLEDGSGPWLRTGDLGFLAEGRLYVTGRSKDLIILRGENRYPQDLEWTVQSAHASIYPGRVVAFSFTDGPAERLCIVAELREHALSAFQPPAVLASGPAASGPLPAGTQDALEALADTLSSALALEHELTPDLIVLTQPNGIPKTSSGKLQRSRCRDLLRSKELPELARWTRVEPAPSLASPPNQTPPASAPDAGIQTAQARPDGDPGAAPWEDLIVAWLESRLGRTRGRIDPDQPFAQLGMDSITTVAMSAMLGERLGVELSPTLAWEYATPRALAYQLSMRARQPKSQHRPESMPRSASARPSASHPSEPIAIIGLGCRFPGGASSPALLWQLLEEGRDAITEVPPERWEVDAYFNPEPGVPGRMYTRWGGFLPDVDQFEPELFGIPQQEATLMDPQQRLLLEVSREALEAAGYAPERLSGENIGVYLGVSGTDYAQVVERAGAQAVYRVTGTLNSVAAGRIAYAFGLQGPAMVLDTACSSSAVAIHQACQSLRAGECALALAGGVNLVLTPQATVDMCAARALSPTGRCRSFSAEADGYVRSDGCGVVLLKPLAQAQRDGDPIWAVLRGTALSQDGRSNGLTAPNPAAQEAVLRAALERSGLHPAEIDYVECHGTGTRLGDPIEVGALAAVYQEGRSSTQPLLLGAVKSNLGHAEAAAGIAGLLKTVLALCHERLPRTLHCEELNPLIPWSTLPFQVVREKLPWQRGRRPRRAAVSSFGLSGTNAQLIVEEAPLPAPPASSFAPGAGVEPSSASPLLLTLSARTNASLRALALRYAERLAQAPELSLADVCWTASVGRTAFAERLAVVADTRETLLTQLKQAADVLGTNEGSASVEGMPPGVIVGSSRPKPPRVAFLFPGQGSQYVGMGRGLFQSQPVFRQALERCAEAFRAYLERPLLAVLYPMEGESSPLEPPPLGRPAEATDAALERTLSVQAALFSVAYSLAKLWQAFGVRPDLVFGQSQGELAAACVGGILTLAEAARIVACRCQVLGPVLGKGGMLLVGLPEAQVQDRLAPWAAQLSIGVLSSRQSTVVSGELEALDAFQAALVAEGRFCRRIPVEYASHSPQIDRIADDLRMRMASVAAQEGEIPFYSTVEAKRLPGQSLTADYWVRNLRDPVRLSAVLERVVQEHGQAGEGQGHSSSEQIILEISPHPLLADAVTELLPSAHVPSLQRQSQGDAGDSAGIFARLAYLWAHGVPVDWAAFYTSIDPGHEHRRVVLPTYPFVRTRYWVEEPSPATLPDRGASSLEAPSTRSTPHPGLAPGRTALSATPASLAPPVPALNADGVAERGAEDVVEHILTAVRRELGWTTERFDVEQSLLHLGVQSLQLTGLQGMLQGRFGVRIPTVLFFDGQISVRALATRVAESVTQKQTSAPQAIRAAIPPAEAEVPARSESVPQPVPAKKAQPFVPYKSLAERAASAPRHQGQYLQGLIDDYTRRTPSSKAQTQAYRTAFATNRNITGLTPALKEMTYQVIAARGAGAHFWDLDGHDYIDLTMGFGALLFGHRPPALTAALQNQLQELWSVGPVAKQAGPLAQRIAAMTGQERVAFFNSGTEAVMVAIRLARAVTGRPKIAVFAGAYHGMFDGVLGVPAPDGMPGTSQPMAPGVPGSMVADTLVIPYGTPDALRILETHAHELAAVLVEPVQSRRPDFQPRAFLLELRALTRRLDVALVFDELVTGFRLAQGGAQAWFGVRADLTTYGKTIGGGMPIGLVTGSARYMDALDGGFFQFGDDSFPSALTTFTAGTFNAHPLALACAMAFLDRLEEAGPALQRELNARTRGFCARVNGIFADAGLPLHVVQFASLFRFEMPPAYAIFFHWLVSRGVYVWELRGCFLSTAHSDADLETLLDLIREAAQWLKTTVAPSHSALAAAGYGLVHHEASRVQVGMHQRCLGLESDAVYHVTTVLKLDGAPNLVRLEAALTELVSRHESLRTSFHRPESTLWLRVHPVGAFELQVESLTETEMPSFVRRMRRPFDLSQPALIRCGVGLLQDGSALWVLDAHHLIVDGLSMDRLMHELFLLYEQAVLPPPPTPYSEYLTWERKYLEGEAMQQDRVFWHRLLADTPPRTELPADEPAPSATGALEFVHRFTLEEAPRLRAFAQSHGLTSNMLLNTLFQVFLARQSGTEDILYGSPSGGRPDAGFQETLGLFIGVVIWRVQVSGHMSFRALLEHTRTQLPRLLEAQHYPFDALARHYDPTPGRMPIFDIGFSFEVSRSRGRRTLDGLTVTPLPQQPTGVLMNLVLECLDDGERFHLRFVYNPRRYHASTVEGWAGHLQRLSRALLDAPDAPLSEVW